MIVILLPKTSSYCIENLVNSWLLAAIFALYLKLLNSNLINQT